MPVRATTKVWITALALATSLSLAGCGGGGSTGSTGSSGTSPSGSTSPTMMSAGDAPMSSVIAALITVSAVSFTSSSTTVQGLDQPRQIELTHLGGIRAPLGLKALPEGTYTSLSLTVSAAQITYIDPNTNQVVVTNATIPAASATTTITLNPALNVSDSGATDVRFDFDLSKSLDLTGSTVTFTPSLSAAVARVKSESTANRVIYINGTVSAVSTSANTLTLTTNDSNLSVTLNITTSTQFDGGISLGNIQTGAELDTVDQLNDDGTITALEVEPSDGGQTIGSNTRADNGLVVSTTRDNGNNLTAFTLVVRDSTAVQNIGHTLTVNIGQGTAFKDSMEAQAAGMATFDQSQIFPGAGLWVTGTVTNSTTVVATGIRPAQVNPSGLTDAAVTAGSGGNGFVINLLLDSNSFFDKVAQLATLNADTNSSTVFDGDGLSSSNVASLQTGAPLVVRGFLSVSGSATTLFATHVHEEGGSVF